MKHSTWSFIGRLTYAVVSRFILNLRRITNTGTENQALAHSSLNQSSVRFASVLVGNLGEPLNHDLLMGDEPVDSMDEGEGVQSASVAVENL